MRGPNPSLLPLSALIGPTLETLHRAPELDVRLRDLLVELAGRGVVDAEEVALVAALADDEGDGVVVGRETGVRRVVRPVGDTHAVLVDGVVACLDRRA